MITSANTKRWNEELVPDEQDASSEQNTIVIENEALRKGFTVVPNYILSDTGVSFGARLTYMLLLSYAWKEGSCFPGQDKLAGDLGVTRKAVNKYLSELKDSKYVSWDRRGLGRTNVYYILNRQAVVTPQKQGASNRKEHSNNTSPDVTKRLHQNVTIGSHQEVTERLHNKYTEENDTKEQQHSVVADKLRSLGVSHKMVHELVSAYEMQTILEKLDLLEWKTKNSNRAIQDKAAWIVKAIIDNYALPADFLETKRKSEQKAERQKKLRSLKKQIDTQNQTESSKEDQEDQKFLVSLMDKYGTTTQEKNIWGKARTNLESLADTASYKLWLAHAELLRLKNGQATIYAQNTVVKQHIESRFTQVLSQAICMALGEDYDPLNDN